MLSNTLFNDVTYDLVGLATRGLVTVGRSSRSRMLLESPTIPSMLSRKHAQFLFQPDANIILRDMGSTNGTYASRHGVDLRKLGELEQWVLMEGDLIAFGGPRNVIANDISIANPFVFVYSNLYTYR